MRRSLPFLFLSLQQWFSQLRDNGAEESVVSLLRAEWHSEKNPAPSSLTPESCIPVWWRCTSCSQEFTQRIRDRVASPHSGCPTCGTKKRLVDRFPAIAAEWDVEANASLRDSHSLTVETVCTDESLATVTWRCHTCRGTWQQSPLSRTTTNVLAEAGCPTCLAMRSKTHTPRRDNKDDIRVRRNTMPPDEGEMVLFRAYPQLRDELDPRWDLSLRDISTIKINSRRRLKWRCFRCRRAYDATPFAKVNGMGCPKCQFTCTVYANEFPEWNCRLHHVRYNRIPKDSNPSYFPKKLLPWTDHELWN